MSRMSRRFTKQRTVLGVPVARRRTDWSAIRKAGMVGAAAVSTVAGGIEARRRGLPGVMRKLPEQLTGQLKKVTEQLGNPVRQLAGTSSRERARLRHDGAASGGSSRRREDIKKPRSQKKQSTTRDSSRSTRSANSTKRQQARAGRS
jgi:hypothetical protein